MMIKHVTILGIEIEVEDVPYKSVKPVKEKPIINLNCCCCGEVTRGRQWWNRDTGFGLCAPCADRISLKEDEETMQSCYGKKGIHYAVKEEQRYS